MKKPAPKGTFKGFMKSEPHEVKNWRQEATTFGFWKLNKGLLWRLIGNSLNFRGKKSF